MSDQYVREARRISSAGLTSPA